MRVVVIEPQLEQLCGMDEKKWRDYLPKHRGQKGEANNIPR
jgi:hypothetical protein